MIIKELYLKNFGKFSEKRFVLDEHMQVFYGENEYGKSTIYAFIKAMLFGLERGRGRAAAKDAFSRYEPWEHPHDYAGELRFVCGGRTFCLKRRFDRYGRNAVLYCEDDGEELSVEDGDLNMLLDGITADSFENTAAVGQLTARPGQTLAEELKNYAANYYASGSGGVDVKRAMDTLKERRADTERELKKCAEMQKQELDKLEVAERYIQNDVIKLQESAARAKEKLKEIAARTPEKQPDGRKFREIEDFTNEREEHEQRAHERKEHGRKNAEQGREKSRTKFCILRGAGAALCVLGALLLLAGALGIIGKNAWFAALPEFAAPAGAVVFLAGIVSVLTGYIGARRGEEPHFRKTTGERRSEESPRETDDMHSEESLWETDDMRSEENLRDTDDMQAEKARAEWELQHICGQLTEKQVELGNVKEQKEELLAPGEAQQRLEETKQALELAMEHLAECAAGMTEQFGERLNREASQILGTITDGKYTRLFVEENLQMSVYCEGRRIGVERLSRGTVEQIYFALRMAALDLLYEERIPVIFDDAFGCYDEKRLKSTLKWLSDQDRQVIIFSCHKREKEMIETLKKEMSI